MPSPSLVQSPTPAPATRAHAGGEGPGPSPLTTLAAGRALGAVLGTARDPAATIARVGLGLLMFPHGAQHALGWFGGYGFRGTHAWMTGTLGFPSAAAALAIVVELLGSLALLAGVGGRLAALGIIGLMLGAISTHASQGFFMNWFGRLPAGSEGFGICPGLRQFTRTPCGLHSMASARAMFTTAPLAM